jgi:hypothetical protein
VECESDAAIYPIDRGGNMMGVAAAVRRDVRATNSTVIARLDRAIQYSRGRCD